MSDMKILKSEDWDRIERDLDNLHQIVAATAVLSDEQLAAIAAALLRADKPYASSYLLQTLPEERRERVMELMVDRRKA